MLCSPKLLNFLNGSGISVNGLPRLSCSILLFGINRVVIGENVNFVGEEELLKSRGVELIVLNDAECVDMMRDWIAANDELWNEDIGEEACEAAAPVDE